MKFVKQTMVCIAFIMILNISLAACSAPTQKKNLWDSAMYTEDTTLGTGEKKVQVTVKVGENSVVFTLHTDKETLEEALTEHQLISGEQGMYGMYVKTVNGIEADYEKHQAYWGLFRDGASMQTGVSGENISGGETYELVYTR